jgi:type IV pilus assembly protein PilY1
MNLRKLIASLAGASALAFSGAALPVFDPVGDDTDIFLANPLLQATRPNVLLMIDNTANWNQPFSTEKAALVNTVNTLVTDQFNVGLAMFVETGGGNDSVDGAYIRYGIRQMTPTNKSRFTSMVTGLDITGDKSNNAVYSLAMAELFRYFAGRDSASTFGKEKRDYPGNIDFNPLAADLPGWPFPDDSSRTFISPIVSGCQKNFIIFISNGKANDNSSSLSEAQTFLTSLTGVNPPTTLTISPNGQQGNWADEYAQYMASADCAPLIDGVQNVITYTIDVLPGGAGSPPHTPKL